MKNFGILFGHLKYEELRPNLCHIIEDKDNKDVLALKEEADRILRNHRLAGPKEEYMIDFIKNEHYLTCLLLGRVRQIMSPIDSNQPFCKELDDLCTEDVTYLIQSSGSEAIKNEAKIAGNLFTVLYYFCIIIAGIYDKHDIEMYPKTYEYQKMIKRLSDDIFNGDRNCFASVLQQIGIHYGLMEMTIIKPLYVAWIYLQEHGFHSQEEIGEIMWKCQPKIDKNVWTRMASFPIMEYIRLNKDKNCNI